MAEDRVGTQFRIPRALHDRLMQAADERLLSANWLVTRAIEDYLSRLLPPDQIVLTRQPTPEPPVDAIEAAASVVEAAMDRLCELQGVDPVQVKGYLVELLGQDMDRMRQQTVDGTPTDEPLMPAASVTVTIIYPDSGEKTYRWTAERRPVDVATSRSVGHPTAQAGEFVLRVSRWPGHEQHRPGPDGWGPADIVAPAPRGLPG